MKKIICMILAASLLMSGCSSINKVDEEKVKDITDKVTKTLINSTNREKAERNETHTINADSLSTLKINSSVGDIKINTHESKDAVIKLNISAQTASKEDSEKMVEDFTYSLEETSDSIELDTSFLNKLAENINLSVNLEIALPGNIDNIIISSNVGDISIKNINGKYEVKNNVGSIDIKNSKASYNLRTNIGEIMVSEAAAYGNSEFTVNTGDIKISLNDIKDAKTIKASTDVGDINIDIPNNSSYEAVINEFMEKEKTISNDNKDTKITVRTGVGSVKFN